MVTIDDVRHLARTLPRAYEVVVRGRIKFRVGQIVFVAFSKDQTVMGFGFPKEQRNWLIGGAPDKFRLPPPADLRYHWVEATLERLGKKEMEELVVDAWRMCVPKGVAEAYQPARLR